MGRNFGRNFGAQLGGATWGATTAAEPFRERSGRFAQLNIQLPKRSAHCLNLTETRTKRQQALEIKCDEHE